MPAYGAGDLPFYLNLNLIVPVVSAVVVIVLAIVIICYLRGRNAPIKGKTGYGGANLVILDPSCLRNDLVCIGFSIYFFSSLS